MAIAIALLSGAATTITAFLVTFHRWLDVTDLFPDLVILCARRYREVHDPIIEPSHSRERVWDIEVILLAISRDEIFEDGGVIVGENVTTGEGGGDDHASI